MTFKKGDVVKIVSDNENYDEYVGIPLIVTHVARNRNEHPGYDEATGENLYDLKTESGEDVPFSLYDYELESSSRSVKVKTEWLSIDTNSMMKESMNNFINFLILNKVDFVSYQSETGSKLYIKLTKNKDTPKTFDKEIASWSYYNPIIFLKKTPVVSDYNIIKDWSFTNTD